MKTYSIAFFACILLAWNVSAQTVGTCKIFPSKNPWNERVDSLAVHWNSDKYLGHISGKHLQPDFSIPFNVVGASQPFVNVTATLYPDESDPGPMPIPPNALQEQPLPPSGDAHVLVVDTGNHRLYELYQGIKQSDNSWDASSTAIFALDSNNYRPDGWTSCDAAGLPIFPGLLRYDECAAGEIKHALRFTIPTTQRGWIFPARHHAGSTNDTTVLPMGARLRLKASFDDSKFTGFGKVISTALKKYGIILADNGSAIFISGEPNANWPQEVQQIRGIYASDLEVVYTGPVRTQSNQYPTPVIPLDPPSGNSGTGVFHVTSNPFSFGAVKIGEADTMNVSMSNSGNGALIATPLTFVSSNPDFSILAVQPQKFPPDTLQPGEAITATIRFAPTKLGRDTTTFSLQISGSPGTQSDTTVILAGEGLANSGITPDKPATELVVYPNPTAEKIIVEAVPDVCSAEIVNLTGQSLFSTSMTPGTNVVKVEVLPNGVYLLRLRGNFGVISKLLEVRR